MGGSLGQGPVTEITLSWVKSTSSFFPVIVSERIIISPRLKCACNSNGKQLTYLTSVNQLARTQPMPGQNVGTPHIFVRTTQNIEESRRSRGMLPQKF